jgi:hypothetical protein
LTAITAGTAAASKALVLNSSSNISGINSVGTTTLVLGGNSLGATQSGYLTGITAGTAAASKAVVLNSSSNISGIGTLTTTGSITSGNNLLITNNCTINNSSINTNAALVVYQALGASSSSYTKPFRMQDPASTILFDTMLYSDRAGIGTTSAHSLAILTNNSKRLTITSSGEFGFGIESPVYKYQFVGQIGITGSGNTFYNDNQGAAAEYVGNWAADNWWGIGPHDGSTNAVYRVRIGVCSNTSGSWSGAYPGLYSGTYFTMSDYRLKNTITPLSNELHKILKLNPVSYYLNQDEDNKILNIGFIAHELQEQYPEFVSSEKDGKDKQSVNYSQITAVLTKGMQEQQMIIEDLKQKNIDLEARLSKLEKYLNQ